MEKIVVSDTNIFIDLISVNLLDGFFSLPWEIHTTDLIVKELKRAVQHKTVEDFCKRGYLKVRNIDGKDMARLARMKLEQTTSNASIQDCSV